MSCFYDKEGRQISEERFIEAYSDEYIKGGQHLRSNSSFAEEKINKILERKTKELQEEDVFNILAWKLGKIDGKKTYEEQEMHYRKGWNGD